MDAKDSVWHWSEALTGADPVRRLSGEGDQFDLEPGEVIIRSDAVRQSTLPSLSENMEKGIMVLTNKRLIVLPLHQGSRNRLLWFLRLELPRDLWSQKRYDVPYNWIRRIRRWAPEFSAPVFIQTTDSRGITYQLIEAVRPWKRVLPVEAQRAHVEAVEAAVAAAAVHRGLLPE